MSITLLSATAVSKNYTLWRRPIDRLAAPAMREFSSLVRWQPTLSSWVAEHSRQMAQQFSALHPIDFSIRPGESIGIIGRNGSGKSTLLQILAGTLTPSTGTVNRQGRLAALLELGSGFNPEFTGRENVYLQGSIYGLSEAEMKRHLEEVLAFSEIGKFVEQPVKTYSSGMLVRLAFATQVVLRPDVMIVDEALAVGDVFFQAKCATYFRDRLAEGMSLVFVSHDLVSVKALCREAIVLHEGRVRFRGDSKQAVNVYHEIHSHELRQSHQSKPPELPRPSVSKRNWTTSDEIGTREAEFLGAWASDECGTPRSDFVEGDTIRVELSVRAAVAVPVLHGAFQVVDRHNRALYGVSTIHRELPALSLSPNEEATLTFSISGGLGPGEYLIDAALGWGDRGDGAFSHQCHRVGGILKLAIGRATSKPRFLGPVDLRAELDWRR